MRRRMLYSTLAVAVSAVLLLGVPLAIALGRLELNEARQQLDRDAVMVAKGLQYRQQAGKPTDPAEIARTLPDMYLIIRRDGAPALRLGKRPAPGGTVSSAAVAGDFAVTVEASGRGTGEKLTRIFVLIGSLGALA